PERLLGHRGAFATALVLAMGTGTFPGFAFGVLGPSLVTELGLSRVELGLLTTVFFTIGGFGSLSAGRAVDRIGARRIMVAAFAAVAAALVAIAGAPSYPWLLVAAGAAGFSLAAGNPTTNKAVAEHLPPGSRGLTMGAKQAGVQLGAFIAGVLLAPAATMWGWRQALLTSALVPVLGIGLTLLAVPADQSENVRGKREPRTKLPRIVHDLAIYAFLMGAAVAAVNAYLPLYAVERLAMSLPTAGAVAATIGFVGMVSRVLWGWGSERLASYAIPLMVLSFGATVAIGAVLFAPALGAWVLWPAAVVFGATAVTWNSVGMLALLDRVNSADAGRASGIVLFGFYTGFVPSPLVFGAIVDVSDNYDIAWTVVLSVLVLAGALVFYRHSGKGITLWT
ncbi:MAG: MFS transporter, partial [Dehalococcoidia bacterium]